MAAHAEGRRQFLGGLLAAGLMPAPTWADAGSPTFLSAAMKPDGSFVLCRIGADLHIRFELPLPARGHAAVAHPTRPEALAFARRPGTFAIVIDCVTGVQKAILKAPKDRHFYGHGTFSSDGSLLYTTENDYQAGRGRIDVWDAAHGYQRIDDWDSGGIGPHDIKRLPGSDVLVVANGGIDTHPDTGRVMLNIATMAPNLAYVDNGNIIEIATLPDEMHKNSIRHLAVGPDGQVAFGMQWQGDGSVDALVGTHQIGSIIRLMSACTDDVRRMDGYIGSIALVADSKTVAVTSPRGGLLQLYDVAMGSLSESLPLTVATRYFMPWKTHPTMALTGAQCLASCVLTPGTVADGMAQIPNAHPATITLEHASGQIDVIVDFDRHKDGITLNSAGLVRTARLLVRGEVMVPKSSRTGSQPVWYT